jgi:hypothetical protein
MGQDSSLSSPPAGSRCHLGCRAKNPGLFGLPRHCFRDSSRAPDIRAGMTAKTALVPEPFHYIVQDSIIPLMYAILAAFDSGFDEHRRRLNQFANKVNLQEVLKTN